LSLLCMCFVVWRRSLKALKMCRILNKQDQAAHSCLAQYIYWVVSTYQHNLLNTSIHQRSKFAKHFTTVIKILPFEVTARENVQVTRGW
jgi:hypothetical protein